MKNKFLTYNKKSALDVKSKLEAAVELAKKNLEETRQEVRAALIGGTYGLIFKRSITESNFERVMATELMYTDYFEDYTFGLNKEHAVIYQGSSLLNVLETALMFDPPLNVELDADKVSFVLNYGGE